MALPSLIALGGLGLGVVGALTATDVVSLREVAHAANLPLLSGALIGVREAMPGSVAHALEPVAALMGLSVVALPVLTRLRFARPALALLRPEPAL